MSTASSIAISADVRLVSLAQIQTDEGSQARVKIHAGVVRDYAAAMTQQLADGGLRFPPVVLFTDGQSYWVGDGFHRILAARQDNLTDIEAEVRPGTQRDALLFSISANSTHGLPRTNADKRKAVNLLLADEEWNRWSDREIARRCGVSDRFVNRMRERASANGSQMRERKVRRGDKVYEMSLPTSSGDTPDTAAPVSLTDPLGIPVPPERSQIFAAQDRYQEAKDLFLRLTRLIDQIAKSPGGEVYRQDLIRTVENGQPAFACPGLRTSLARLCAAEPYCCYCPACQAAHPGQTNVRCKACAGRGWITRAAYDSCPQHEREQVLKPK
jgi:hypothetical protein